MAEPSQDISAILAALASHRPAASAPGQPPATASYAPPSAPGYPPQPVASGTYQPPGASYGVPQPAASGSLDLNTIRPDNSGSVSLADAIARARALAAEKGVQSFDRTVHYASNDAGPRDAGRPYNPRSRSRSPQNRRDHSYRDNNFNSYQDQDDRGGRDYGGHDQRGRPGYGPSRHDRERSPVRGDDNSETMDVDATMVGLIIGRKGESLSKIEADSGCRVQFLPPIEGNPMRRCKISGPRARRAEARAAIERVISESGSGGRGGPGGPRGNVGGASIGAPGGGAATAMGGGANPARDGEDHLQVMVPDRTVGLIIGRHGETIRDLQERSGCHINIVGESKSVNGLRPVNLIGSLEAAQRAKEMIMEIVDSDSPDAAPVKKPLSRNDGHNSSATRDVGGSGDKIHDFVMVPSDAVGMIIGKKGETIRDIQTVTGCKINVSQPSGPGETQREIALIGSRDSINRAKQAIEEKVEAVREKSSGGPRQPRPYHGDQERGPRGAGAGANAYGAPQHSSAPGAGASQPGPPAPGGEDPYAQYGGYQAYITAWYQHLFQQQQQQQQQNGGAPAENTPSGHQ